MSLKDWLKKGWLVEHQASQQEIADLLTVAERDMADCRAEGLSPDWRLNIAYNAALQCCKHAICSFASLMDRTEQDQTSPVASLPMDSYGQ